MDIFFCFKNFTQIAVHTYFSVTCFFPFTKIFQMSLEFRISDKQEVASSPPAMLASGSLEGFGVLGYACHSEHCHGQRANSRSLIFAGTLPCSLTSASPMAGKQCFLLTSVRFGISWSLRGGIVFLCPSHFLLCELLLWLWPIFLWALWFPLAGL